VLRRAVVLDKIDGFGVIVLSESADESDARFPEGIDVLVVVPDRHDAEPGVALLRRPARQSAHQGVLPPVDVLVLVHQDVAVTAQEPVA